MVIVHTEHSSYSASVEPQYVSAVCQILISFFSLEYARTGQGNAAAFEKFASLNFVDEFVFLIFLRESLIHAYHLRACCRCLVTVGSMEKEAISVEKVNNNAVHLLDTKNLLRRNCCSII
jgi:hypothetical protein